MSTTRIQPPTWALQPFERELALREVRALSCADASWCNGEIVIEGSVASSTGSTLRQRLAFASGVSGAPTAQYDLEQATRPGQRKVTSHALHGLHPYKGKFYPQLVRSLLNSLGLSSGSTVLDPFAGCGTTVLEAALLGVRGLGVDANPLAVIVSRAKLWLLQVSPDRVDEAFQTLDGQLGETVEHPDASYLRRWFPPENFDYLLRVLKAIEVLPDQPSRAAASVVLSSVLREASYQDPRQVRVYRRSAEESIPSLEALFHRARRRLLDDLLVIQAVPGFSRSNVWGSRSHVLGGDARHLFQAIPPRLRPIDAVVTSPPYAMALPYIDTDRLSLRALGLLTASQAKVEAGLIGSRELAEKLRRELEREALSAGWMPGQLREVIAEALQVASHSSAGFRKVRTPSLLYRYFRDMRRVLAQVTSLTTRGTPMVIVIGDNKINAVDGTWIQVPTVDLVSELARRAGFTVEDRLRKRLTSYGAKATVHQRNAMGEEEILFLRRD